MNHGRVWWFRDVTERYAAHRRLEGLINSIDGIVLEGVADPLRFTFVSKQAERILGYPASRWLDEPSFWVEHLHDEDRDWVLREVAQDVVRETNHALEYRMIAADGRTVWLRGTVTISPEPDRTVRLRGVMVDVTAVKELEEQLRQSFKMEAIGRLAGGVAHDFNNLLSVIGGYAELLSLHEPPSRQPWVKQIRDAADRAGSLTKQLLAFSRRQILKPTVFDLNAAIVDMDGMLRRLIGEDVTIVITLAEGRAWVEADRGQLEQVVLNLAVNARDAMPRGGRLTIATEVRGGEPTAAEVGAASSPPGKTVRLRVTDTGTGMAKEALAHLFEPYFTTKGIGKGTGLGLSMVYGIVQQSGGTIHVQSVQGDGTSIEVVLPNASPAAEVEIAPRPDEIPVGRGSGKTILLVEDEDAVRGYLRELLTPEGYTVIDSPDPAEAMRLAGDRTRKIDLLLTDVVMPEMSGRALSDRIMAEQGGVKVLYMSGYTDDAILRHGVSNSAVEFLQKPFGRQALLAKIERLLAIDPERPGADR